MKVSGWTWRLIDRLFGIEGVRDLGEISRVVTKFGHATLHGVSGRRGKARLAFFMVTRQHLILLGGQSRYELGQRDLATLEKFLRGPVHETAEPQRILDSRVNGGQWTRIEVVPPLDANNAMLRYVNYYFPFRTVIDFPVTPSGRQVLSQILTAGS